MAAANISTLAGDNASKQNPPAMTAREQRAIYRAMGILETHLKRPASNVFTARLRCAIT